MPTQTSVPIDVGIKEADRNAIAQGLTKLLADTYTLYLKTHNFHWNVVGPQFQSLHLMFEQHYNEIWLATDLIAERVRALGVIVPATYADFRKLASIQEESGDLEATKMVRSLLEGHEAVVRTARGVLPAADKANDQVTIDLLTQRMQIHEKTAWMLRSLLAE